jgi:hypothetical protein
MEELNVFFDFLFLKTSSTSQLKSLVYNGDILLEEEEKKKEEAGKEKEETLYKQFYGLHTMGRMKWNIIEKHFNDYTNNPLKRVLQYSVEKIEQPATCSILSSDKCALITLINTDNIIKVYIGKVIKNLRNLINNLHFIDKSGKVLDKTERKEDQKGNILIKKEYWEPLYDLLFESFEFTREVRGTEQRKLTSIEVKKNITKFAYMLHSMSSKNSPTAEEKMQYIKEMDYHKKVALNVFNTEQFGLYQKPNFIDEAIETFNFLDLPKGGNKKKKNRKTRKKSQNKRRKSKLKKTKKR